LAILATTPPAAIGYRLQILQDGIAATPAFTELRTALVEELAGAGRLTDAAWAARTAVQQDPVSRGAATGLVTTLVLSGRNEEAIDAADRALRLWPNYYPVVRARFEAALWAGKYDEAKRLYANPANTLLIQPMAATRPLEALFGNPRTVRHRRRRDGVQRYRAAQGKWGLVLHGRHVSSGSPGRGVCADCRRTAGNRQHTSRT
jgi:tetratricopeptide (TPR) repeat protein